MSETNATFQEVNESYSINEAIAEAKRCLNCKNPSCKKGCPIENDIPGFIHQLSMGNMGAAMSIINEKSNLPAICGRVCPHEKQCQGHCVLYARGKGIQIGKLERFIADFDTEMNLIRERLPQKTRGKVAVIGSGPAGLTVAGDLARQGFSVTIFDGQEEAGGVLMYGIPEYRLPKVVVRKEIEKIEALGVSFELNCMVGKDITVDEMFRKGFDAIFIGTGTALPKALVKDGIDCRVVMPLYGDLKFKDTLTYVTNFSVPVGWRSQYCGLFKAERDGVVFYFIDNEYYFKRSGLYGFYDDGERFAFFSRAILEMLFYTDFEPDIINCNDWQTALTPVYLNLYYRHLDKFSRIKTVFTIHNIAYQGKYGLDILEDTCGIGARDAHVVEYDGCANFMKGAIETADKVTTVSPTYAQEILDPWFSHGLDGLLRQKQYKTCGILNGIDVDVFNPATDPDIAKNYDVNTVAEGKAVCKAALQDEMNLHKDGSPVMAMVTRLVGHKGVDLVRAIAEGLLQQGIELVVLGSGEAQYENFFNELCARNPGRVGVYIGFNAHLAQRIYAGADMFLMPSRSEPCGLAQMVSCRYGTIPIVRETGGLKDSIHDSGDGFGNGFTFANYNAHELYEACWRAKEGYWQKDGWPILVRRAMECDFSWANSAKSYEGLYNEVVNLW